jgi:hypothetical protein
LGLLRGEGKMRGDLVFVVGVVVLLFIFLSSKVSLDDGHGLLVDLFILVLLELANLLNTASILYKIGVSVQ